MSSGNVEPSSVETSDAQQAAAADALVAAIAATRARLSVVVGLPITKWNTQ
jgi:hypothetical protein